MVGSNLNALIGDEQLAAYLRSSTDYSHLYIRDKYQLGCVYLGDDDAGIFKINPPKMLLCTLRSLCSVADYWCQWLSAISPQLRLIKPSHIYVSQLRLYNSDLRKKDLGALVTKIMDF